MNASPIESINGLRVSRETQQRLEHFGHLFIKWSKTINLVAPSTIGDLYRRHIMDSAQIFSCFPGPKRWIDLGSGGGFPGIITAILLTELKDGWVDLVESNGKKAAFLRVALQETGARGSVRTMRIESAPLTLKECDALSARALADLSQLLEYCLPWMDGTPTRAFFHKGRDYQLEVDKADGRFKFDLIKHQSIVEPDSVVLEIANLSRKSGGEL
ncbi:16S rRNA (guanine(527)-N(7))-methyltransferase RsmG [Pararhizobium gei]|uniref:16S rRNA (guanine(527)-N(7))-methyltransferase RsmG n=1 Tax=Pararhizobium gei TaxID=1395951 RepID=UPI0023DA0013|nr:16S rRNA (guanine(527)-N(7))-methyltransferase RsmG [Rhizobium gei]